MNKENIKRFEKVTLQSDVDLIAFGECFLSTLLLPPMEYYRDRETEWLDMDYEDINYNIVRPLEEGTLQDWDETTPQGCNFGIVIGIYKNHPYVLDDTWVDSMISKVCQQLARAFNTIVYHHSSFIFGIDKSKSKNILFIP